MVWIIQVSFIAFVIYILDLSIIRLGYKGRWFQLHTITNAMITYLSYNDTMECFTNPKHSIEPITNYYYLYIILITHLYHCVAFKIRFEDWLHHIISVIIPSPIFILYPNKANSVSCFFICGLPGTIDYAMLTLYKNDMITKKTQKMMCAYLNTYIRMPGCIVSVYLLYKDSIALNSYLLKMLALITYGNACFYGKQSIESYERFLQIKL